jgi:hypothetical protein
MKSVNYKIIYFFIFLVGTYIVFQSFIVKGCDSYYLTEKERLSLVIKANNGDLVAIKSLIDFNFINCNGNRDDVIKWLRKSAEFGSDKEYYNLGDYLINFNKKDTDMYNEGLKWLKKSKQLGNKQAQKKLKDY